MVTVDLFPQAIHIDLNRIRKRIEGVIPNVSSNLCPRNELAGTDHKFGYLSIAGIVTVPLGGTTNLGAWNVHFGGEYQQLGDTTKSFNGGEGSQFIGSVGVGFSY